LVFFDDGSSRATVVRSFSHARFFFEPCESDLENDVVFDLHDVSFEKDAISSILHVVLLEQSISLVFCEGVLSIPLTG
jgi:hypothetical protein